MDTHQTSTHKDIIDKKSLRNSVRVDRRTTDIKWDKEQSGDQDPGVYRLCQTSCCYSRSPGRERDGDEDEEDEEDDNEHQLY